MILQRPTVLWTLLLLLLCSCLPQAQDSSSAPPAPDTPLSYTPTDTASPLFDININPSNSLESSTMPLERPLSNIEMLDAKARKEYDALKKQQAAVESRISELDNMRRGADYDIIQALSSGGAKMGGGRPGELGFGDTQSYYEDPHIFIQNKQWEREFAVNETVEKRRELSRINRQIDQLLEESARSCFPPATAILMGNGDVKQIMDIKVGDSVTVYDIAKDALSTAPVMEVFTAENNHYYQLNERVTATAYERFLTQRGWRKIRDLTLQDEIFNGNGFEKVSSLGKVARNQTVYNLHIDSAHNFFVSSNGEEFLLVHNSGGGGGGK